MHPTMIVHLPVADVARSRSFFGDLGYEFDERLGAEQSLTVKLGDNLSAMLTQTELFDGFHPAETTDASKAKECVLCLSVDSRDGVDALVDRALAAGATAGDDDDHEFMYGRSFDDLDGHSWQIFWMAPES